MAGLYDLDIEAQVLDDLARNWDDPDNGGDASAVAGVVAVTAVVNAPTGGATEALDDLARTVTVNQATAETPTNADAAPVAVVADAGQGSPDPNVIVLVNVNEIDLTGDQNTIALGSAAWYLSGSVSETPDTEANTVTLNAPSGGVSEALDDLARTVTTNGATAGAAQEMGVVQTGATVGAPGGSVGAVTGELVVTVTVPDADAVASGGAVDDTGNAGEVVVTATVNALSASAGGTTVELERFASAGNATDDPDVVVLVDPDTVETDDPDTITTGTLAWYLSGSVSEEPDTSTATGTAPQAVAGAAQEMGVVPVGATVGGPAGSVGAVSTELVVVVTVPNANATGGANANATTDELVVTVTLNGLTGSVTAEGDTHTVGATVAGPAGSLTVTPAQFEADVFVPDATATAATNASATTQELVVTVTENDALGSVSSTADAWTVGVTVASPGGSVDSALGAVTGTVTFPTGAAGVGATPGPVAVGVNLNGPGGSVAEVLDPVAIAVTVLTAGALAGVVQIGKRTVVWIQSPHSGTAVSAPDTDVYETAPATRVKVGVAHSTTAEGEASTLTGI